MGIEQEKIEPRRDLPGSYSKIWSLDLSKDPKAAILLNVAAFPLFFLFGWIFLEVASHLKPGFMSRFHFGLLTAQPVGFFLIVLAVIIGVMVFHEAIHGAFFWIFTGSKPVFGLKLLFAYAGAPEWYIPRNQYAFIGIAPFVVITLLGFLVILVASDPAGQLALFGITMNASGAVGDFYVSGKVTSQSRETLVQDTGVGFTMFAKLDSIIEMRGSKREGGIDDER